MKTCPHLLLLFAGALLFAGRALNAESNLHAEHFPRTVRQGDVCLIRVTGPPSLKSIHGTFQGEKFPIAFGARNGIYEGLIGIDMSLRPTTYEIKVLGTDEDNRVYSTLLALRVEKVDFGTQTLTLPSSMVDLDAKTLERVNQEARQLKALFQAFRDERLWRGPFILPVAAEVSAAFGLNRIINGQRRSPHTGVDLRAEEGTPVLACNTGVVVLVDQHFFSGKSVILDHGWGLYSMYFHLSKAMVKEGDRVSTGAVLGWVGSTGRSTAPHLHWGIRVNGARVDPLSLLRIEE